MASFGEDVEFGGDAGFLQLHEVLEHVLNVDGIVLGLDQESGRRGGGDWDVGVEFEVLFGDGEVAWIDDEFEVWLAALLVGCVDGRVEALVEMRAERDGEVGSG